MDSSILYKKNEEIILLIKYKDYRIPSTFK